MIYECNKAGTVWSGKPRPIKESDAVLPGAVYQTGKGNHQGFYLFDKIPVYDKYINEHKAYGKLLSDNGVEVYELSDLIVNNRELMSYLPNLAYLNDISVITCKGAILSTMCPGGRQYEEIVVREALTVLGIPILHACETGEQFEGLLPYLRILSL